ncbi:uncharacterized protein ACR2FA_003955 isoform 1-T3 [Aphomia sociella]
MDSEEEDDDVEASGLAARAPPQSAPCPLSPLAMNLGPEVASAEPQIMSGQPLKLVPAHPTIVTSEGDSAGQSNHCQTPTTPVEQLPDSTGVTSKSRRRRQGKKSLPVLPSAASKSCQSLVQAAMQPSKKTASVRFGK